MKIICPKCANEFGGKAIKRYIRIYKECPSCFNERIKVKNLKKRRKSIS